jgi:hypothetical protein
MCHFDRTWRKKNEGRGIQNSLTNFFPPFFSSFFRKKKKINVLVKECFRSVLLKPVEGMRDRWSG